MKYLTSNISIDSENAGKTSRIICCLPVNYASKGDTSSIVFFESVLTNSGTTDVKMDCYSNDDPELSQGFYSVAQAMMSSMLGTNNNNGGEME